MQAQAINFQAPTEEAAPILLPVTSTLFADRAARFASLAEGNSLGDWLAFLGQLSRAQQNALPLASTVVLPAPEQLALAREHAMPPLDPGVRPVEWRAVLHQLVGELAVASPLPPSNVDQPDQSLGALVFAVVPTGEITTFTASGLDAGLVFFSSLSATTATFR